MKPSEFYEKYVLLQDHNGKWHKPRPLFNYEKVIMDSDRNKPPIRIGGKTLFPKDNTIDLSNENKVS